MQCGGNFFILGWRRVLTPAPKVLGSDIKTHLNSRFCLRAILIKMEAMLYTNVIGVPDPKAHDAVPAQVIYFA